MDKSEHMSLTAYTYNISGLARTVLVPCNDYRGLLLVLLQRLLEWLLVCFSNDFSKGFLNDFFTM